MALDRDVAAIATQMSAYHAATGTSMELRLWLSDGVAKYVVHIATKEKLHFEFTDAQSLIAWLVDVNADIDPGSSAVRRQMLQQLKAEKIRSDAEVAALEQEIGDQPDAQIILDAQAAAAVRIAAAEARLEELAKEQAAAEALADELEAQVAAEEAALNTNSTG